METNIIGFVHFDKPNIKSNRVEGLVVKENASKLLRNKFIKIVNANSDKKEYIGRILEGPFFQPEEISRDSALAQVAILRGSEFPIPPNFYATIIIEIIGELEAENIRSTSSRPVPQSKILELDERSLYSILGLDSGNLVFGNLEGYPQVPVKFDSKKISIIPRNIGIFGTVGSGKTNTAQVLIEELAERETEKKEKWAVIVLDVEGEYTKMREANTQPHEVKRLTELFKMETKGILDFHVLKLSKHDSVTDDAQDITINIDQLDEYVLSEILQTTEPQTNALFSIIDELKAKPQKVETSQVYNPFQSTKKNGFSLSDIIKKIDEYISRPKKSSDNEVNTSKNDPLVKNTSLGPLKRKLLSLKRTNAFDDVSAENLSPEMFLVPGRVTVIDLSYTGDTEKNLLTAQLLKRVFDAKKDDRKKETPKTMIIIEEAHTFISKEHKDKMTETIRMIKEIARRGRKRWLSLCFISQQPAHLPNEIFELANTRIVHNIRSANNLEVLKYSSGDVTEEMWDSVPSLGVGQAIINGPQFKNSLVSEIRLCRTRRVRLEDIE